MRTKFMIMMALILTMMAVGAHAEIVTYQLPAAFEREYNFDEPYLQMDFDLGVTFTEISNVYIDWSGEITAGLAGSVNPDDLFPMNVGIYASLGFNPPLSLRITEIRKGAETYPDAELFDELSEIKWNPGGNPGGTNWSDLLDGQGTITIGYTELIMIGGYYIESGIVAIDNADLVVVGQIVPEPISAFLFGMGLICIRQNKRKRLSQP